MIGRSSKMNRLARRRESDDIEAEEREVIGQRRTENIDQRNRENPGVKPPSPSRRA
ncbi:BnaC04g29370D [Brassica napus]|uniref:BnaC04g29370D protein n=1 Tax=Brassica napus TaxID=3708 RepID=A0A078H894_BRANA|nr:BnaC04g29370D [Brassica napus]